MRFATVAGRPMLLPCHGELIAFLVFSVVYITLTIVRWKRSQS